MANVGLNSVLAKMDGEEPPCDGVVASDDTVLMADRIKLQIDLIELECARGSTESRGAPAPFSAPIFRARGATQCLMT